MAWSVLAVDAHLVTLRPLVGEVLAELRGPTLRAPRLQRPLARAKKRAQHPAHHPAHRDDLWRGVADGREGRGFRLSTFDAVVTTETRAVSERNPSTLRPRRTVRAAYLDL